MNNCRRKDTPAQQQFSPVIKVTNNHSQILTIHDTYYWVWPINHYQLLATNQQPLTKISYTVMQDNKDGVSTVIEEDLEDEEKGEKEKLKVTDDKNQEFSHLEGSEVPRKSSFMSRSENRRLKSYWALTTSWSFQFLGDQVYSLMSKPLSLWRESLRSKHYKGKNLWMRKMMKKRIMSKQELITVQNNWYWYQN